jgi:hypothetical protein
VTGAWLPQRDRVDPCTRVVRSAGTHSDTEMYDRYFKDIVLNTAPNADLGDTNRLIEYNYEREIASARERARWRRLQARLTSGAQPCSARQSILPAPRRSEVQTACGSGLACLQAGNSRCAR